MQKYKAFLMKLSFLSMIKLRFSCFWQSLYFIQCFFPPEKTKGIFSYKKEFIGNILAALLGQRIVELFYFHQPSSFTQTVGTTVLDIKPMIGKTTYAIDD